MYSLLFKHQQYPSHRLSPQQQQQPAKSFVRRPTIRHSPRKLVVRGTEHGEGKTQGRAGGAEEDDDAVEIPH